MCINILLFRSPIEADEKEIVKLAKKLKKEKVNIDVVSFGEDEVNTDILNKFITTINGKEGTGSHLVTIPPGPHLSDALVSSPIVQVTCDVVTLVFHLELVAKTHPIVQNNISGRGWHGSCPGCWRIRVRSEP